MDIGALLATRRARRADERAVRALTDEWYATQRAVWTDRAQLVAWHGGRRMGKTRAGVRSFLDELLSVPGSRQLYINETAGEAERLAWVGNRGDGFEPLLSELGMLESGRGLSRKPGRVKLDRSTLSIHCPDMDSWIYLRGADDEAGIRRALGGAYNRVWWDEAQKIPSKLATTIREVFMPALLDFRGRFVVTGTAVRQMLGLFYEITRPELDKRMPGWSVHFSNLLENPYWGHAKGRYVVWGARDEVVSGPHMPGEMPAAISGARWEMGMVALQRLLGGPEVAPFDGPTMQREGFGRWVREDASYVYHVHQVPREKLVYAPHRTRADGFPDIRAALQDLPWGKGEAWREGLFALGGDLGYHPDPFAFVLWGWHMHDRRLYEVASWKRTMLDSDEQARVLHSIRAELALAITVVDAGGPAKPTVVGWSKEWVERYSLPIEEAQKAHKHTAIEVLNGDIRTGGVALRDGSPLMAEMEELQWLTRLVDARGRMIEDPTQHNHCCDAALYAHRHSYQYRWRPEEVRPAPGTPEHAVREEAALEDEAFSELDEGFS